uniref:DUF5641 domain-containing protein n=1 Tax=Heligmosomoides polygyrus TaxID=6339 RepID=A0A183GJU4_HELPZ
LNESLWATRSDPAIGKTLILSIQDVGKGSAVFGRNNKFINRNRSAAQYLIAHPCKHDNQTLRPIDFIQRGVQVTHTLGITPPDSGDPGHLPSNIEPVGQNKGCQRTPQTGAVVPLCDPNQPRHCWKVGVINKLLVNNSGTIREAVVRLSSQRLIRPPVNFLDPLKLGQEDNNQSKIHKENCPMPEGSEETLLPRTSEDATKLREQTTSHEPQRYHLIKRRKIKCNESLEESDDIVIMLHRYRTTFGHGWSIQGNS